MLLVSAFSAWDFLPEDLGILRLNLGFADFSENLGIFTVSEKAKICVKFQNLHLWIRNDQVHYVISFYHWSNWTRFSWLFKK